MRIFPHDPRRFFNRAFTRALPLTVLLSLAPLSYCGGKTPSPYFNEIVAPIPGRPHCADPLQASGFNGGTGTQASPYLVCNYEQFNLIRDDMSAHYAFGQDIDATPSWSEGMDGCAPFDGVAVAAANPCDGFASLPGRLSGGLEGQGYVLRNLYSNRTPTPILVGPSMLSATIIEERIESGAYVRNLGIADIRYRLGESTSILVIQNRGSIDNVYIVKQTNIGGFISNSATGNFTSLMVNLNGMTGTINNSFTAMNFIIGSSVRSPFVYQNVGNITNCYTRGSIESEIVIVASLIAAQLDGGMENVYTTGIIRSTSGGIAPPPSHGALIGEKASGARTLLTGTNYYVSSPGSDNGVNGIGNDSGADICNGTCTRQTLNQLRQLATLPSDWSADNWDLRDPTQTPALKFGGGPNVCGELCGQIIPNQPD